MSEDDRLAYSVREVAAALGIGTSTTWKYIAAGIIPAVRLGNRTLVTRATLQQILEQGSLAPEGQPRRARVRAVK